MNIPMNVYVSKAFDYLSVNTHYTVVPEGKSDLLFRNNRTGGATVLYKAEVERAFGKGWLVRE
jgi:hypothetical protein